MHRVHRYAQSAPEHNSAGNLGSVKTNKWISAIFLQMRTCTKCFGWIFIKAESASSCFVRANLHRSWKSWIVLPPQPRCTTGFTSSSFNNWTWLKEIKQRRGNIKVVYIGQQSCRWSSFKLCMYDSYNMTYMDSHTVIFCLPPIFLLPRRPFLPVKKRIVSSCHTRFRWTPIF